MNEVHLARHASLATSRVSVGFNLADLEISRGAIVSRYRKRKPKPGTIWRRNYYERHKAALIDFLGGRCTQCGVTTDLTFDHISGDRDWEPSEVHSTTRLRMYETDALNDKLQLLCIRCNSSKSDASDE